MPENSPNLWDQWRVAAVVMDRNNDLTEVRVTVENAAWGKFGPFSINVAWHPGMEARDVEAFALLLLAQSGKHLVEAMLLKAGKKSQ